MLDYNLYEIMDWFLPWFFFYNNCCHDG